MSILISAKDIYKTYKVSAGDVSALNGVSCDFEEKGFYAIVGRSGSGKSTLLHILGGLDKPTSGEIFIDGEDICKLTDEKRSVFRRRYMGFVFQQYNLLDEYNVRNNICMPLKLDKRKPDEEFYNEVINTLGLEDKTRKYPSELSGGEQQRVAIARSVIAKPKLIIADEPTGNLDKKTGEETIALLLECSRKFGQTLIIATHDMGLAERADSIVNIEDGRVIHTDL